MPRKCGPLCCPSPAFAPVGPWFRHSPFVHAHPPTSHLFFEPASPRQFLGAPQSRQSTRGLPCPFSPYALPGPGPCSVICFFLKEEEERRNELRTVSFPSPCPPLAQCTTLGLCWMGPSSTPVWTGGSPSSSSWAKVKAFQGKNETLKTWKSGNQERKS